jgi:hypothetical protein
MNTTEFAQESSLPKLLECMYVKRIEDVKAAKDIVEHISMATWSWQNSG